MSAISTTDARALFTKMLVDVYKELPQVMGFLRSFFPDKIESTKELSIEVQRGTERVAADVIRGSIGNRNQFSRSSEKIFIPPYLREYFDATELSLYDRLFGSTQIDDGVFSAFLEQIAEKLKVLQDKMERRHELMCAQVLQTGIVTYDKGTSVDFHRKVASNIDKGGGNYWATGTVNPYNDLANGAQFIREKGKSQGSVYNAIMGRSALSDFLGNTIVKERSDIRNFGLDTIREPQRNSVGGSLHGQVTAGDYKVNLWTYPEIYENSAGTAIPYIDTDKVIMLPETPMFKFGFAAVPQLVTQGGGVKKGKFIFDDFVDDRKKTHEFDIQSAGLPIPTAVDQIYTVKVVA
jgi:hypothetical protein